jgi:dihydroorotate dehydrogenase
MTDVFGLTFPNRIGLAAGFDKNGKYFSDLFKLGFGFIEIGTVTPVAQPGNPKPRMFRIPEKEALINRMGFNNDGLDALIQNVKGKKRQGILGISIGKNAKTSEQDAIEDYVKCLDGVYSLADYVAINISSPNTAGLRDLQHTNKLSALLGRIKEKQSALCKQYGKYTPLVVKIAPDLTGEEIRDIAHILLDTGIDSVIATNTTTSRQGIESHPLAKQAGGLSGSLLTSMSLSAVRELANVLEGRIPVIGSGGVMNPGNVEDFINAGATLVQLYTGLVYYGPSLVAPSARTADNANLNKR